jgi:hypothetical protein
VFDESRPTPDRPASNLRAGTGHRGELADTRDALKLDDIEDAVVGFRTGAPQPEVESAFSSLAQHTRVDPAQDRRLAAGKSANKNPIDCNFAKLQLQARSAGHGSKGDRRHRGRYRRSRAESPVTQLRESHDWLPLPTLRVSGGRAAPNTDSNPASRAASMPGLAPSAATRP